MIDAIAIELVTLHMVDGRPVQINPAQVVQLRQQTQSGHHALIEAVECIISLTDGRYLSVAETCEEVQKLLEGLKP